MLRHFTLTRIRGHTYPLRGVSPAFAGQISGSSECIAILRLPVLINRFLLHCAGVERLFYAGVEAVHS
jgi:hypothetical protein